MSTIIGIREVIVDDLYSPAKEKAASKGSFGSRWAPLLRRARQLLITARVKLVLSLCALCVAVFMISWTSSFMGWIPEDLSPSLGGYTVLINTWKGNSLLKQSVAHYASCGGTDAIHVGFVPRIHLLDGQKIGVPYYKYGGWWSVWWTGAYSIVLSKAAFFHQYLDLYTHSMPPSIQDYFSRERDCEDIAMSLPVANVTGSPPIWGKGKIHEIGSSGISSLKWHSNRRNKCLNDLISLYGAVPLVSINVKAADARREWFW